MGRAFAFDVLDASMSLLRLLSPEPVGEGRFFGFESVLSIACSIVRFVPRGATFSFCATGAGTAVEAGKLFVNTGGFT